MDSSHGESTIRLQSIRHRFGDVVQQNVVEVRSQRATRPHTGHRQIDRARGTLGYDVKETTVVLSDVLGVV